MSNTLSMKAQKWTLVLLDAHQYEIDRLDFPANHSEPPIHPEDWKHLKHYVTGEKYSKQKEKRQSALDAIENHRYQVIVNDKVYNGPGLQPKTSLSAEKPMAQKSPSQDLTQMLDEIEQLAKQRDDLLRQSEDLLKQVEKVEGQQKELAIKTRQALQNDIKAAEERLKTSKDSLVRLDTVMGAVKG